MRFGRSWCGFLWVLGGNEGFSGLAVWCVKWVYGRRAGVRAMAESQFVNARNEHLELEVWETDRDQGPGRRRSTRVLTLTLEMGSCVRSG